MQEIVDKLKIGVNVTLKPDYLSGIPGAVFTVTKIDFPNVDIQLDTEKSADKYKVPLTIVDVPAVYLNF